MTTEQLCAATLQKDWLKNDPRYVFPKDEIERNHEKVSIVIEESDIIKKLAEEKRISIGNLLTFDPHNYLEALDFFSNILRKKDFSEGRDLEHCFVRFLNIATRSENENNDDYYQPKIGRGGNNEMSGLFNKIVESGKQEPFEPLLRFSVRSFVEIITAQPCINGNHRAADFILNLILMKNGLPFFALTENNVEEYYSLFNTRDLQAGRIKTGKMIEFMAKETLTNIDRIPR